MPPVTAEEPFAGLPFTEGARQAQAERDRVAVRALLRATLTLAGLLWLSVPLQLWLAPPSRLVVWRLLIGAVLLAGAGGAVLITRRSSPRVAAGMLLLTLQLSLGLYAWFTGLGLQSILLSASAVLIVLAGVLTRPRVAWLLAGLHGALLVLIHYGELHHLMPHLVELPAGSGAARLVSHLLASPGLRINEIAGAFKQPVPGIQALVKKLVAGGMVRFEGNTRARKYFAAQGATSASDGGGKRGKRGGKRAKN